MTELVDLTLREAGESVDRREVSSLALTEAILDQIDRTEPRVHAYAHVFHESACAAAEASDRELAGGTHRGPLHGVPVAVKDIVYMTGAPTEAGSRLLAGFVPDYDATIVRRLRDAGAVIVGKTVTHEFAWGTNIPVTRSPWHDGDYPGGSSAGSGVTVTMRSAFGAIGTDTGGSVRIPGAVKGIVGLKPTYGRCSRWGVVAFASSLDQPGPLTRTVEDSALLLQGMAGHDPKDSTSAPLAVPDFAAATRNPDIKGLKVGIPKEYRVEGTAPEIVALWDKGIEMMKAAGAAPIEVSLPHTKYALPAYYIVAPAECSSNLARYDGVRFGLRVPGKDLIEMYQNTRGAGFGKEVRRRVMIGTYVLSAGYYDAYYKKAQQIRALIARDFKQAFEKCDVLLTPTAPTAAFAAGEKMDDPVTMYLNDMFTIPASMAGLPGISVPAGLDKDGLPLGLQIIGRAFDEETMLRAAAALEKAAAFNLRPTGY